MNRSFCLGIVLGLFFFSGCIKPENSDSITFPHSEDISQIVSSEGGLITLSFNSTANWVANTLFTGENVWVDIQPRQGLSGDNRITITVDKNNTFDQRVSTIRITAGTAIQDIVITQKPQYSLIVTPTSVEVDSQGGSFSLDLSSNDNYEISIEDAAKSWIKEITTRGLTDNQHLFQVAPNEDITKRIGTINIDMGAIKESVIITQKESDPILTVFPNSFTVGAAGDELQIEIKANVSYNPLIPSDCDWVDVLETKSISTAVLSLLVKPNENTLSRSTSIIINGLDGGITSTLEIRQRGYPVLETMPATSISGDSATLNGILSSEAEETPLVWFYLGKADDSLSDLIASGKRIESALSEDGSFHASISNLDLSTQYSYVACARVDGVDYYGSLKTFETQGAIVITTLPVTDIEMFTGLMHGNLIINKPETSSDKVEVFFNYSSEYSTLEDIMSKGTRSYCSLATNGDFETKAFLNNYSSKCYYVAVVSINYHFYYGEVMSFTSSELTGVDMGVSVEWSPCNLGTTSQYGIGSMYYAWGEVSPKQDYSWETYQWCNGTQANLTKYNNRESNGTVDNKSILEVEDDAASVNLGEGWRMPTYEEVQELIQACKWEWVQIGVGDHLINGCRATSKITGNSIFFPTTGYRSHTYSNTYSGVIGCYWFSTLSSYSPNATCFYFKKSDPVFAKTSTESRYLGFAIRPVSVQ